MKLREQMVAKDKERDKNLIQTRKFSNMLRIIDDLTTISSEFKKAHPQIYPLELQLKRENSSDNKATFLDLDMEVVNKKFSLVFLIRETLFRFPL